MLVQRTVVSVHLSFKFHFRNSHLIYFGEIWYWEVSPTSVKRCWFWLTWGHNNYCTHEEPLHRCKEVWLLFTEIFFKMLSSNVLKEWSHESFYLQTYAVTDAVQKVCEAYKCKPIEGMLSHQLKQFKIDGEKTIIQNPNDAQKKEHEKYEFATHEVYAMDVLVSTGEGVVSFIFLTVGINVTDYC